MKYFLTTCFSVFIMASYAQDTIYFKKGLMVEAGSRYGREAIYTDRIAYQLYQQSLTPPADGAVFVGEGTDSVVIWRGIEADSLNRFISRRGGRGGFLSRGGNYLYLTYSSDKAQPMLLNVQGASSLFLNGEPHTADPYASGWLNIPVMLKKGLNEFYIRGGFVRAVLIKPSAPLLLGVDDPTLPHVIVGGDNKELRGAVVVINTSVKPATGLKIRAEVEGAAMETAVPEIPAMSTRKVAFNFNGSGINAKGKFNARLSLMDNRKTAGTATLVIESVNAGEQYSETFTSDIDGSLQYYSVAPQKNASPSSALFLSVHGAGVEAINQARAYQPKDWGNLVAATNRRPRGFNWEDWGRMDALEVLEIAKRKFNPDPSRVYLTGHSMGGHGTWFLGATYPDKWAAIAPCAGYPTLKGYGSADGLIPDSSGSPMEQLLIRSSNQSDVIKLAPNYQSSGVYIFHGDSDRVVSVDYARQMRGILGGFHKDMSYYEYPGGEHWFGDISVDWKPIFDFFSWHRLQHDSAMNAVDFITASPGISSSYHWVSILQQHQPLMQSRIKLHRNKSVNTITGTAENIRILKIDLPGFAANTTVNITLDSTQPVTYSTRSNADTVYVLNNDGKWSLTEKPGLEQKGPHRYGTFKDAFNHRMIFVYGTSGTREENEWSLQKAKYDAETWYYRGNGAVDIISDKQYSAARYPDRGVILYGNSQTNAAWKTLLADCPIQVDRTRISAAGQEWRSADLAAYFVWPLKGSSTASVGVVSGTGIKGMRAANANQYFAGASGFPDFMIFGIDMLRDGAKGVKLAGFFDHQWKIDSANYVIQN